MSAAWTPDDAFRAVDTLRFAPRPRAPRAIWARVKTATDMVSHNFPATERVFVALNPYPHPFRLVDVATDDGPLSAWLAPGRRGAPGLLLAPGTLHTKDDTMRKAKAIRVWRDWGWSVLAMDQRGFGGSWAVPGSGGLLEADDVLAAARHLREATGCGRVAIVGESLGGAAALNAAARDGAADDLAAVAAWSPFADLAEAVTHLTVPNPDGGRALAVTQRAYRVMLWARSHGRYRAFDQYLADRAQELGMDVRGLLEAASPVRRIGDVRVPALIVHAEDDPVVPVRHARLLAEAAKDNPNVAVRILPSGGHLFFDAMDDAWYWGVMEAFVRRLAEGRSG